MSNRVELERFAHKAALAITVFHFPPRASQWNKVEQDHYDPSVTSEDAPHVIV
jgi:hypothetical protein